MERSPEPFIPVLQPQKELYKVNSVLLRRSETEGFTDQKKLSHYNPLLLIQNSMYGQFYFEIEITSKFSRSLEDSLNISISTK